MGEKELGAALEDATDAVTAVGRGGDRAIAGSQEAVEGASAKRPASGLL